jgi:hypothetical protein
MSDSEYVYPRGPYLELTVFGEGLKTIEPEDKMHAVWFIDVGGKIEKYISDGHPTDLLQALCKQIASGGIMVKSFSSYRGSGGPSHILRNGTLFRRIEFRENPDNNVFAYQSRVPTYRGAK